MENSKIEWTDHTFNPWVGCTKVSAACKNCYAEKLDKRWGRKNWGADATRTRTSDENWKKPLQWNRKAAKEGIRYRVFCASLADVFEIHQNPEIAGEMETWRDELWKLIEITPHLDWLLLTKRPENIMQLVPKQWHRRLPDNIWIGTTVEDQKCAEERIPHLLNVPAKIRFLSCEPMMEPINLPASITGSCHECEHPLEEHSATSRIVGCQHGDGTDKNPLCGCRVIMRDLIHWVICGGESGPGARPMHPVWARSLRDQCKAAEVPFLFKQWGEYGPSMGVHGHTRIIMGGNGHVRSHGCESLYDDDVIMAHYGKQKAGRQLDGEEWNQIPTSK